MIFKTYARYELNVYLKINFQIKIPGIEFNTWTRHKKLAKL